MVPSTSALIDQTVNMIAIELQKLQIASDRQGILDPNQSKVLQGYFKCLIDAQRENREQDKHNGGSDDLSSLEMLKQIRIIAKSENDKKLLNALDDALSKLEDTEEQTPDDPK